MSYKMLTVQLFFFDINLLFGIFLNSSLCCISLKMLSFCLIKGKILKLNHIMFDLDGVLLNSLPLMEKCWNTCMLKYNLKQTFQDYKMHIGKPFCDIMFALNIKGEIAKEIEFTYHHESLKYIEEVELYDDIEDFLRILKKDNFLISIVTSKARERVYKIIETLFKNDKIFDSIVTPEDLAKNKGKPEPDGLLLALKKTNTTINTSIYVGDMEVDMIAAHRCNCPFVFAHWGYGQIQSECKGVNSIKELQKYIYNF